jgi:hypothetical protein
MTMTGQQRIAFTHPCYDAEECSHGRYRVQRQTEGVRLSVIVTVNIGLE